MSNAYQLKNHRIFQIGLGIALCLGFAFATQAASITMYRSDPSGSSSFNNGYGWTGNAVPTAGNDYIVDGALTLRTPFNSNNYTFAGDSLTVSGGASLAIKAGGNSTLTVNNLTLNNGSLIQGSAATTTNYAVSSTWAGNINLAGSGTLTTGQGGIVPVTPNDPNAPVEGLAVTANVSGTGVLSIMNQSGTLSTNRGYTFSLTLSGNNTYSGGTILTGASVAASILNEKYAFRTNVIVSTSLGTGNVTFNAANGPLSLELDNNTAIYEGASLIINTNNKTNWTLNLNYLGSMDISSFVFDGQTYNTDGFTIGAMGSGADFMNAGIIGSGLITIAAIPEPSTYVLIGIGLATLTFLRRRKSCKRPN